MFKDECVSLLVQEFVGLQSKMYSILLPGAKAKFTAKGSHVFKHLKHEVYLHTLKTIESSSIVLSVSCNQYRTV